MEERLIAEFADLIRKITKLETYLATEKVNTLPVEQQDLLKKQLDFMIGYYDCLGARITLLMK